MQRAENRISTKNLIFTASPSSSPKAPRNYQGLSGRPAEENCSALEPDPVIDPNPAAQNFVTCIHRVRLGCTLCSVTVTWAKTLISHCLYFTVDSTPQDGNHYYTCKIDLKTWQFWGKKGLKTFKVAENRVDVYWDLRSAKFSTSPEPNSDYYVAVASEGEVALLLGDQKKEAFKRTKCRPSLEDASLVHKKEIVFAKKCFCTKTTLGYDKKEHSIMIESALTGPYGPEMWISVDGIESIRVPNLHWRFRGNEVMRVEKSPVQVFWDVHDWLYGGDRSAGVGVFLFRRADEDEGSGSGFGDIWMENVDDSCAVFCHFLYACRTE